ncbi:UNVERIFIED_CONTAM: hypothetical protein GTU68_004158 [Idotea baltica]|nr:hypothetical protein [Idotea baltica]
MQKSTIPPTTFVSLMMWRTHLTTKTSARRSFNTSNPEGSCFWKN